MQLKKLWRWMTLIIELVAKLAPSLPTTQFLDLPLFSVKYSHLDDTEKTSERHSFPR